jgi:hypothetical protein
LSGEGVQIQEVLELLDGIDEVESSGRTEEESSWDESVCCDNANHLTTALNHL